MYVMSANVSIIIPVLNEESTIAATLKNLQALRAAQQTSTFEIIIVDGGSEDGTAAIAEACLSENKQDGVLVSAKGRARQMNAGASASKGGYLLFLHADTRLPENILTLIENWQVDQPDWGFFPVKLSGSAWLLRIIERAMNWRSRLTSIATGDQCLFVHRSVFESLGGFADIALMEDIELCKRLKRISRPDIQCSPVLTSSRKWEREGLIRTMILMWRLRLAYFFGVDPDRLVRRYYQ